MFPSVKDCQLVRPDVSICSLPGSTFWAPGNLFIITCIQESVFPNDNSCREVGRDQDQCGSFLNCNILFGLGTSETIFSQMLKCNQRIKLPVLFSKPSNSEADIRKAISFYLLNTIFFRWPGKLITLAARKSRGTVISTPRKRNYRADCIEACYDTADGSVLCHHSPRHQSSGCICGLSEKGMCTAILTLPTSHL